MKLLDLITEFEDVFAVNPKKPRLNKNLEHRIITQDALPQSDPQSVRKRSKLSNKRNVG